MEPEKTNSTKHFPVKAVSPPDRWDVSLLKERFADKAQLYASPQGDVFAEVAREHVFEMAKALYDEGYDYCAEVTAVDYLKHKSYRPEEGMPRFTVVYVLYSTAKNTQIILRVPVPEDDCKAPSLAPIWNGADWMEREVYDLMGVVFEGHPDLRRIMMWEGYEGHPERKDFPWRDPEWENPWRDRHPGKI